MYKFPLKDGRTFEIPTGEGSEADKNQVAAKYLVDTWKEGGKTPSGDIVKWSDLIDLIHTTEVQSLLSTSTQLIMQEPIEPVLVLTSLYTKVRALGMDTKIVIGGPIGAISAGDADEGGNYPEAFFSTGGGISIATVGKSGIQASFSDEVLRYSTWDLMAINLRLMRAALARHTEWRALHFLLSMGVTLFDNADPTNSLFGVTSGRSMAGAVNGSLTMDDLMTAYTHMIETGFTPDTLVMSPQFYFMWVKDPVLRHLFFEGVGRGVYFATYTGEVAPLPNWTYGGLGGMGPANPYNVVPAGNAAGETANTIEETSNRATSAPVMPFYGGLPLRIIVSPLMPYDPATKLGTIFLVSSGKVGYHIIDEDPVTVEWRDEDRELVKVKIRQRDSFAVAYDGAGIAVLKNIKNTENYFAGGPVQYTQAISGSIEEIDRDTAVPGL